MNVYMHATIFIMVEFVYIIQPILRNLIYLTYSGSTAWNDPHQFAAMAAAAAGNMENLEMLSSLLGTQHMT